MSIKQNQIKCNPFVHHFLLNVEGKLSSIASLGCVLVRTAVVEERRLWLQREDKTKVNVANVHRRGQKSLAKIRSVSHIILLNK